jgi:LuxR family maltose regulon positive regulatory protein
MRDEKSTLQNNSPELLSTKLSPPRLHPTLVPREGLLRRLDEGLQHQLTLLSAPAGFGKTTLVRKWMAALQASQAEDRQRITVAWLSLDRGDNDPIRFWRYVVAALRRFDAEIGTTALNMFRAPQSPPFETFLTSLINDLVSLPTRHVLVLEDYHVINTAQIHEALTFLIDYLPTTLHLIIISCDHCQSKLCVLSMGRLQ